MLHPLLAVALLLIALASPRAASAAPRVITLPVPVTKGWYLTPDSETLILSSPKTGELIYFNVLQGKETRRLAVPFKPAAITGQKDLLFVAVEGGNIVHALRREDGEKVRQYRLPGEPVQALACHPESGPIFASNLKEEIFSLAPDSTQATKTNALGMFLCVDPVTGKHLFAGTNRPSEDVLEFQRSATGQLQVKRLTVAETATVARYAVQGSRLKLVDMNANTAVGFGGYLHLSPDGKKFVMVAGGGWRSPTNRSTRFDMAVFDATSPDTMLGGLEIGGPQTIAFHPVLPIGVAQGANYDYSLFDAESLVVRQQWRLKPPAVNFWHNLAAFGGKGTVFLSQQGESLQFFILDLTPEQKAKLEARYGKLPEYPDALPVEAAQTALAAKGPTPPVTPPTDPGSPEPPATVMRKSGTDRPTATKPIPKPPAGKPLGRQDAPVHVPEGSDLAFYRAVKGLPYLQDRDYRLMAMPKSVKDSAVLVRDSSRAGGWPSKGTVEATRDCTAYLAVMYQINGSSLVKRDLFDVLESEGWKEEKDAITTTSAEKETWGWKLFSKPVQAGPLTLSSRLGLNSPAQAVYFFR
ncbi:YncE family protein [Planctomyces sp. SH-PL14]|uniref:YncE family protein n=1 Tax=Planctomyces sp. SH-PL14 TaxID=1632864 RepID=UPI00078DB972|nr:hypothetical protein [Planctomyces sp. SH-PL14]AMV20654.1 hypothetical protein VT03_22330 [Planctomyces sp. SH-PL14]